jgi:hypothetical protein
MGFARSGGGLCGAGLAQSGSEFRTLEHFLNHNQRIVPVS